MPRRKKNSARVNLIFSVVLHGLAVLVIFFFAAREGLVGNKLKEIMVAIVPKEKPKPVEEKPPDPPPVVPPKEEQPKVAEAPKEVAPQQEQAAAPPPAGDAAPSVAPAAALPADFSFGDGAKVVETSTNAPVAFYRNFVEYSLRSRWNRPEDMDDLNFVVEVEVEVDPAGKVKHYSWKKTTGNKRWDDSVAEVMAATKTISRLPPKDFPPVFIVRFDVQPATEPAGP